MFKIAIIALCFFSGPHNVTDAADDKCPDSVPTAAKTLRKSVFCGYDPKVRPVKQHTNTTNVEMYLNLRSLLFYEEWDSFHINSLMVLKWQDQHLKWDKKNFNEQESMTVASSEIWLPDIGSYDTLFGSIATPELCRLNYTGIVECFYRAAHSTFCVTDLTRWPFDYQTCSMRLSSSRPMSEINLSLLEGGLKRHQLTTNREWELLTATASRVEQSSDGTVYSWATFKFELKRHPGGQAAIAVVPALMLAVITIVGFSMEAMSQERIGIICVNIFIHCIYLTFMGYHMPANGDTCPYILLFYRDSLLLVGASLFVTLLVRRLDAATSEPPGWITTITGAVLATLPILILKSRPSGDDNKIVEDDGDTTTNDAKKVRDTPECNAWRAFGGLLDIIFTFIFLLIFISLLLSYIT